MHFIDIMQKNANKNTDTNLLKASIAEISVLAFLSSLTTTSAGLLTTDATIPARVPETRLTARNSQISSLATGNVS